MSEPLIHIDTHCHLTLCEVDPAEHLLRARQQGVKWVLDPGLWVSDFQERYQRLQSHPEVLFGLACAPHYRGKSSSQHTEEEEVDLDATIEAMEKILEAYPVAALSEIGLDYYYQVRDKEAQHELLLRQLELAQGRDLPVFLHIREAYQDCLDLVVKSNHHRGAVHCFTGQAEDARRFVDWGFCLSFSGIVTFKKSQAMREIVKETPDQNILTETDSPFLSPVPLRGKPNEAGNITYINRCIAEVKGWSEEFCTRQLEENARRLIGFESSQV